MSTSISKIAKGISEIISAEEAIPLVFPLHDRNNPFQKVVVNFKNLLSLRTDTLNQLMLLYLDLTWHEVKNMEEEELINELISDSLNFHLNALQNIFDLKLILSEVAVFNAEILLYEDTLNDFEDTVYDVKEIFFDLRSDNYHG